MNDHRRPTVGAVAQAAAPLRTAAVVQQACSLLRLGQARAHPRPHELCQANAAMASCIAGSLAGRADVASTCDMRAVLS